MDYGCLEGWHALLELQEVTYCHRIIDLCIEFMQFQDIDYGNLIA